MNNVVLLSYCECNKGKKCDTFDSNLIRSVSIIYYHPKLITIGNAFSILSILLKDYRMLLDIKVGKYIQENTLLTYLLI